MEYVDQIVVITILVDIAFVVKRPSDRPHIHYFKPVAGVSEAPVIAAASRHAEMVLAAETGAEFFGRNALALSGRLSRISRPRRLLLLAASPLRLVLLLLLFALFLLLFLPLLFIRLPRWLLGLLFWRLLRFRFRFFVGLLLCLWLRRFLFRLFLLRFALVVRLLHPHGRACDGQRQDGAQNEFHRLLRPFKLAKGEWIHLRPVLAGAEIRPSNSKPRALAARSTLFA